MANVGGTHLGQSEASDQRRPPRLHYSIICAPVAETKTMSHIVVSRPLTKLLVSRFDSANDDAVQWLENLGRWTRIHKNNLLHPPSTSHTTCQWNRFWFSAPFKNLISSSQLLRCHSISSQRLWYIHDSQQLV